MLGRNEDYHSTIEYFLDSDSNEKELLEAKLMKAKALLNCLVTFIELYEKDSSLKFMLALPVEEAKAFIKDEK